MMMEVVLIVAVILFTGETGYSRRPVVPVDAHALLTHALLTRIRIKWTPFNGITSDHSKLILLNGRLIAGIWNDSVPAIFFILLSG